MHSCIILLKLLAIRAPRFIVDHTFEDAPVCDAVSRVAAAMISDRRVIAAVNVAALLMQTLGVLQTIPILDSGLEGLHYPFWPCG
ncbi:hypothetical protein TNCV_3212871 [Trichonephila clavipes]|nr:hypothetical protein TNCV_3212871 [Trichonephila clavipes]